MQGEVAPLAGAALCKALVEDRKAKLANLRPALLVGQPCEGEFDAAIFACNDYLRLGRGRTVTKLLRIYEQDPDNAPAKPSCLDVWSSAFHWHERAREYDVELERQLTVDAQERFNRGLALHHKRIDELEELYWTLKPRLMETEVKEGAPVLDKDGNPKIKLNLWTAKEMRDTLADIAAEVGGRQKVLLLGKKDPMEDFFKALQTVYAPQLESGENSVVEGEYRVQEREGDESAGERDQPGEPDPSDA